jgi:signal transduction histidine kinase
VNREIEGTGAGLAIVQQVAERHGGRAWVQPRAGGGSEFIITFGGSDTH